jgi:hypothetical protein
MSGRLCRMPVTIRISMVVRSDSLRIQEVESLNAQYIGLEKSFIIEVTPWDGKGTGWTIESWCSCMSVVRLLGRIPHTYTLTTHSSGVHQDHIGYIDKIPSADIRLQAKTVSPTLFSYYCFSLKTVQFWSGKLELLATMRTFQIHLAISNFSRGFNNPGSPLGKKAGLSTSETGSKVIRRQPVGGVTNHPSFALRRCRGPGAIDHRSRHKHYTTIPCRIPCLSQCTHVAISPYSLSDPMLLEWHNTGSSTVHYPCHPR